MNENIMKTKFAIGCLVQWYEIEIIEEYIESVTDAIDEYDGEVLLDFTFITCQDLEKIEGANMIDIIAKWRKIITSLNDRGYKVRDRFEYRLHTIADYRRLFNTNYCDQVDVLLWGESDALVPNQTFIILNNLHQISLKNNKYRGIGISTYIEACGGGGPEYCYLKIGGNGNVEVKIGTQSNGQGHLTSYSQIVSEVLDIDINQINIIQGNSIEIPKGSGTGGSRSMPVGGNALFLASERFLKN